MPRGRKRTVDEGALGGAVASPEREAPPQESGPGAGEQQSFQEGMALLQSMWGEQQQGLVGPAAPPRRADVQVVPNLAVRIQEMAVTLTLTCRFPYPGNAVLAAVVGDTCQALEFLLATHLAAVEGWKGEENGL